MKINFSALKARLFTSLSGTVNETSFMDMDTLDHIEKIIELAQKHGIDRCQLAGKKHINYVSGKFGISPLQAVLFSLFMERANDNNILLSEIAESVKINKIRLVKYMGECEELEKKKLIRCRKGDTITYRIPREVRESIRKYNEYKPETSENLSIGKFFTNIERLFQERSNDELTFETLAGELVGLIDQNMQLEFCKKIMSYNMDQDNLVLLVCFCHLAGNNNDDRIGFHDIEFLYDDKCIAKHIKMCLSKGGHYLIDTKFIVYNNEDGYVNSESWKLSDMAKKELLSELHIKANQSYKKNLILFDSIKHKKMFYNERETKAIETLMSLLTEENYSKIQERLDGKGMRKGFAYLFSGPPGTGKTETAYQIARETKRNIMMVDISQTKSCWYGESEKKIKEIFDSYRNAVENSTIAPILLLNEADAVIGKRKEFTGSSRAVDQTDNAIQNIILQEMENLCGILIATTNMTVNMDKAFERRFLYKITFDKPSPQSRMGIWNSLLPDLPDGRCAELSGSFDLSGGQIENIARKVEVDAIISGADLTIDSMVQYCRDENQNNPNDPKMWVL